MRRTLIASLVTGLLALFVTRPVLASDDVSLACAQAGFPDACRLLLVLERANDAQTAERLADHLMSLDGVVAVSVPKGSDRVEIVYHSRVLGAAAITSSVQEEGDLRVRLTAEPLSM